jgi:hypothetical protein
VRAGRFFVLGREVQQSCGFLEGSDVNISL